MGGVHTEKKGTDKDLMAFDNGSRGFFFFISICLSRKLLNGKKILLNFIAKGEGLTGK